MANGGLIGALRVTLGLDSAQFEAGSKRARGIAQRDARAIQQSLDGVKDRLTGLYAVAGGAALIAATKRALDFSDAIADLADKTGASTKIIQEFRYAAQMSGSSVDVADEAIQRFARSMGLAQAGGKEQIKLFAELGVTSTDLDTALRQAMDGLQRLPSVSQRNATALQLFGKSASSLTALMGEGSKGFDQLARRARELGIVLEDDVVRAAGQANDKLDTLKMIMDAKFASFISQNANSLVSLADALWRVANAAINVSNKLPGALSIAGGAAVGGKVGGAPGALAGGLSGLTYSLFDRATNDPYGVKGMTTAQLKKRAGELAKSVRGIGNSSFNSSESQELLNTAKALTAEINSRAAGARKASPSSPAITDGTLPTPSGGGAKKSRGGGRDRSSDYLDRYNREISNLQDEQLSLQQDITTDIRERARLEHLRIDNEQAAYNFDVENRFKAGELTKAQADALKLQYDQNAIKQKTLVNWRLDDQLADQELELRRSSVELANSALSWELEAARTQEDRRRIQLRILENETALERAALEAVKAKHTSTDAEYQIAQAKLDQLGQEQAGRAETIRRNTMGPLEQWRSEGVQTAAEMREALEGITVDALNSSLDLAARNMFKLKGAAGELMNQLLSDVIRLQLRSMMSGQGGIFGSIIGAVGGLFGGGGGAVPTSWGDTSVLAGGANWSTLLGNSSLPKLATGGSFMAGGISGVDRNVLAINGIPKVRVSANERVSVTPAGQGGSPIVIQMYSEEGPALIPRVTAVSEGVTMQNMTRSASYSARAGRQRLAR